MASYARRAFRATVVVRKPAIRRELEAKFRDNAGRVLAEERVGDLWEALGSLGEAVSVGEVAWLACVGG